MTSDQHGDAGIRWSLLGLTAVTGIVDAVSFLGLGHIFTANMTGNVVFLGFALGGGTGVSVARSLAALSAFACGGVCGGRITTRDLTPARSLLTAMCFESLLLLLANRVCLRNAVVRKLGVPDLTTTVLTLTLTGLAADSTLAGGKNPHPGRRLQATAVMFLGAAVGAFLVLHAGVSAVLALALALLVLNGIASYRLRSSSEAWTAA